MENLNAKDKERLQRAVEGNVSSQQYIYGTKAEYKALADAGLVLFNDTIKDGNRVAVKASDAGIAAFNAAAGGGTSTQNPAGVVATTAAFKITKGIELPAIRRRVGEATGSRYPFDTMEVGDSFHVPKSEDMPNPAKSLASSVTAANRRFSTKAEGTHKTPKGNEIQNYTYVRNYTIRAVTKANGDPDGDGARIWRTK